MNLPKIRMESSLGCEIGLDLIENVGMVSLTSTLIAPTGDKLFEQVVGWPVEKCPEILAVIRHIFETAQEQGVTPATTLVESMPEEDVE